MRFNRPYTGHKSVESAFNGVASYVQIKYPKVLTKTKDPNQIFSQIRKLMIRYLQERNIPHDPKLSQAAGNYNANLIQNDFTQFVEYLKLITALL